MLTLQLGPTVYNLSCEKIRARNYSLATNHAQQHDKTAAYFCAFFWELPLPMCTFNGQERCGRRVNFQE